MKKRTVLYIGILSSFFLRSFLHPYPIEKANILHAADYFVHQHIAYNAQFVWKDTPIEIRNHLNPSNAAWGTYDEHGYNSENNEDIITGVAEEDSDETTLYYCLGGLGFHKPYCAHFWEPDDPQGGEYNHGLSDDSFEEFCARVGAWEDAQQFNAQHFRGQSLQEYYHYESPIPSVDWCSVDPSCKEGNPPLITFLDCSGMWLKRLSTLPATSSPVITTILHWVANHLHY